MSDLLNTEQPNDLPEEKQEQPQNNQSLEVPEFLANVEGIQELGDVLSEPCLKPIKDVKVLVKNYVNAQKMIGKDKVIIPSEQSSPEDIESFWRKLGKPESVEKYELSAPEETALDKNIYQEIKGFAYDNNILPNQAKKLMGFIEDYEKKQDKLFLENKKLEIEESINNLKEEWGSAFENNVSTANSVLKEFSDEETINYFKETGIVNDTKFAKLLNKIGKSIYKEKKLDIPKESRSGYSKEEAIAEYNSIITGS